MTIVLDEAYSGSTADFGPIINKIVASKADALLGGGHYADDETLARQLHDQKADLKWVTLLVAPDNPKFAEAFTAAFRAKYGVDPGYHAAGGYAAGLILQHAIEQAKSVDPTKVAAALNKMNVTTMFGRTKFVSAAKDHGLQVGHDMVLAQWQMKDGKLVKEVIWLAAAKTANIAIN